MAFSVSTGRSATVWSLLVVTALALVARVAAAAWWDQRQAAAGRAYDFADSESYCFIAREIAHGRPYAFGPDRVFRTPVYPALIAPGFWLQADDPPWLWLRGLSIVCGVAAVVGTWAFAREVFDDRAGLFAAALVAVDVGVVSTGVFALSEAPFCPLMIACLALWAKAWNSREHHVRWAFAAGVVAALAALARPSWLLFVPFAGVVGTAAAFVSHGEKNDRPLVRHGWIVAATFVGLILGMSPWWFRNAMVVGEFVPTSLQVGASLYDGVGPQADGGSEMSFVKRFEDEQRAADADVPPRDGETFEARLDRRMKAAAVAQMKKDPARIVELAGVKFLRMWSPLPNAAEFGGLARWAIAATYAPLLAMAVVGLIRFGRSNPLAWLCAAPAVYFTLLHVVFVSSLRYRQPPMLALAVLAGAALAAWTPRRIEA